MAIAPSVILSWNCLCLLTALATHDEIIIKHQLGYARPHQRPFYVWLQCRCNDSLVPSAFELRESFIDGGLDKIRAYVANSTNLVNTQNMQKFLVDNLEVSWLIVHVPG